MIPKKASDIATLAVLENNSGLDPVLYNFYKGLENRTVTINCEIDSDIIEEVILPLKEMDKDPSQPITIYMYTPGGDVYAGMALCDTIAHLKSPTTLYILGMAASMGAYIAMAGHNNPNVHTVCTPYSVFLIHAGSSYFEGSTSQVKDNFRFFEAYEERLKKYVLSHSDITSELFDQKTRVEWWFNADEAMELGIVDEVI